MYGASASAQTFEPIRESAMNAIDVADLDDVDLAMAVEAGNYSHMPGFEEFGRKSNEDVNRANLLKKIKGRQIENPLRSPKIWCICKSD